MTSFKRRKKFVDPQVQGALIRRIILHWAVFYVTAFVVVTTMQSMVGDPGKSISDHVASAWSQYMMFGVILLTLLPAFLLDTVKLSNRFVGPIFRFRNELKKVARGEQVGILSFRRGDFWTDLAGDFNQAVKRMRQESAEPPATVPTATNEPQSGECSVA